MNWINSLTNAFESDDIQPTTIRGKTIHADPKAARLVNGFYTTLESMEFSRAKCLLFSTDASVLLDLNNVNDPMYFIKSRKYFAINYGGYQFGQWNGQLGDGRVLHHGDIRNKNGEIWDVAIKGCGKTPFSRHGDGLLTLKSAVREYLGLEYLAALGIPSTRALGLYSTGETISRDASDGQKVDIGQGGIIARISPSWIRFGSFELFYLRGEKIKVKELADYVINTHYPNLGNNQSEIQMKNRYALLFEQIVNDSALLVAHWQAAGFVHGLLNSENLSIHGLSLHLGPFAFLDVYDPSFAPNLTDYEKRYKFESQPDVFHAHLSNLGKALSFLFVSEQIPIDIVKKWVKSMRVQPISSQNITPGGFPSLNIDHETLSDMIYRDILSQFNDKFLNNFTQIFAKKLGLETNLPSDLDVLITPLLQLLANCRADYTYFFRLLSSFTTIDKKFESQIAYDFQNNRADQGKSPILHFLLSGLLNFKKLDPSYSITESIIAQNWIDWATLYRKRLLKEFKDSENIASWETARSKRMNSINPKYSLKSWILSEICESINTPKFMIKLNQAVKILIHDIYGNESDYSLDERRVSNSWSRPCYECKTNEYQINCP